MKIRQRGWKERLEISKVVKFQSDMLKTNEDIALQIESHNFTNIFWLGASSCLPPYKRL